MLNGKFDSWLDDNVAHPAQPKPDSIERLYERIDEAAVRMGADTPDNVAHPAHYTEHPSGIECIQITEHMGFNLGNAFKYLWRCDLKHDAIEDLEKAAWYIAREIAKRKSACK